MNENETMRVAAALLLDIAGDASEHVRMGGGQAKYYTVHRALSLDVDPALARLRASTTIGHLLGVTTVGAWLWRKNAYTRALCFDADERTS